MAFEAAALHEAGVDFPPVPPRLSQSIFLARFFPEDIPRDITRTSGAKY